MLTPSLRQFDTLFIFKLPNSATMGDSEHHRQPDAPEWQKAQAQAQPQADPESSSNSKAEPELNKPQSTALEKAKKFLQDPEVQRETPERKSAFLKSKGIPQTDIDELLHDDIVAAQAEPESENTTPQPSDKTETWTVSQDMFDAQPPPPPTTEKKEDRPPIITYPEFLTKPTRPPPLMTANGLLNTLYAFGGVSALIYGTSKFVVEPMVDSLTAARVSFHETTSQSLAKVTEKLESTVSEIPPAKKIDTAAHTDDGAADDASSSYDDPSEMFHRDIGVQTSAPASPVLGAMTTTTSREEERPSVQQARRLTELVASVRAVSDGLVSLTDKSIDLKGVLGVFKDELDVMSAANNNVDMVGGYSLYGGANRNEPDDEIKKAKENIRRVKGVLLSTRSFPATTTTTAWADVPSFT
ncbi:peroxisomal membrane anchor protein conserved region-domain-containing protein [Bombardia bombarda]|uniref:Peroxisomal membrane protein PEX14 n=1 Tax=Bombardia bombarda TaxID=252184 RepID=A0AA40CEQ7_9PEZI|nr:peroxisomal membrane anchor protein conserved region-domain-containing protein [Bombardia bombarda]